MGYTYRQYCLQFVISGLREQSKEWMMPADIPLVESSVLLMFFEADSPLDESIVPKRR